LLSHRTATAQARVKAPAQLSRHSPEKRVVRSHRTATSAKHWRTMYQVHCRPPLVCIAGASATLAQDRKQEEQLTETPEPIGKQEDRSHHQRTSKYTNFSPSLPLFPVYSPSNTRKPFGYRMYTIYGPYFFVLDSIPLPFASRIIIPPMCSSPPLFHLHGLATASGHWILHVYYKIDDRVLEYISHLLTRSRIKPRSC
jgi:hypothetical protein